ncbi:uncharacterized protein LOC105172973 [Sesamum indicum]|uniref:Uncharacterized protein LOC105172973 n=1 Tax=Sesamum indicum TaxID=4182 RepID=A0A6I9U225_SESIN|nr:uncharacterized protein LOC105172973 [Sesamum indicum]
MKNAMDNLQDLIQEVKLRTVWWILCIFSVSYFLTHTSKSMLMNIPIAVLLVSGLRILFNEVEFRWKDRSIRPTSYLSHLEKKQLSVNDSRLTSLPPAKKWKRNIDSPVIEAAIEDFINKILHDFVLDLWYSDITPDKEAPELIRAIIMDVLGEVSGRIKEVNLVDLLTRDVVDLIGDHFELFRRNHIAIGTDVMGTLSSEERDERLKQHLLASEELHPALISPECEYKVIQQLMGGLLAVVLRPREAQCPLVRCFAREFLTCLVMQPIMNFASPGYINELIEYIILAYNDWSKVFSTDQPPNPEGHNCDHTVSEENGSNNQGSDASLSRFDDNRELDSGALGNLLPSTMQDEHIHPRPADWAKVFDAATQRRTEVLMPENLENMWTIGRHYKKKLQKKASAELQAPEVTSSVTVVFPRKDLVTEIAKQKPETSIEVEGKASKQLTPWLEQDTRPTDHSIDALSRSQDLNKKVCPEGGCTANNLENNDDVVSPENRNKLKRSNSTSDLEVQLNLVNVFTSQTSTPFFTESCGADVNKSNVQGEVPHAPKLRCQVVGAYFEKLGSNSFAVYSISVTDAENNTWIVKRRYRNFERLHRHLKDIPNYTLHLPPKRIFSSSTEDAFVHQRCIQLDKYLQELLSIANVAEQHEVWDFLSASSKNYSFEKSPSVMTTLAVNVDDAVDDIVRQFKGVSDGIMRMVAGSPSSSHEQASPMASRNLSWNADDMNKLTVRQSTSDSLNSFSDNEEGDKDANHGQQEIESSAQANESHSDNELKEDPTGVPPEWAPPNLTVPVLNLVDKIFQLKRRGWLRRQVFWISKQILQLVMEDAIDDWLLRQIQWLRREDVIAQGIRWIQDVLWPGGTFFMTMRIQKKLSGTQANQGSQTTEQQGGKTVTQPESFEQQLEAARRASHVKKIIFNGAPTALVSLIGAKQYRRCARDIYYFLQSTVCLKQLGYGILELGLITIFPELRDVVRNIHEKMHIHPSDN